MSSRFLETHKVALVMAPVDLNDGATTGDYVNMGKYRECTILIIAGDGTAGSDPNYTVYEANTAAGGGVAELVALETGRIFTHLAADYATLAAGTGLWSKVTQATVASTYLPTTNGETVGIEALVVTANDLSEGYDFIRVDITDPGAAKIAAAIYIMGDPRDKGSVETMANAMA